MTWSMTWMTPLLASTSVAVMRALRPLRVGDGELRAVTLEAARPARW
jgi:hypothetical protein